MAPDDPLVLDQRHRDGRAQRQRARDHGGAGGGACAPQHLVGDVGEELRPAGAHDHRHARRRVGVVRELAGEEVLGMGHQGGVDVGDLHRRHRVGGVEEGVDGAPVPEPRHRRAGDGSHHLAPVGAAGEDVVDLDEELEALASPPLELRGQRVGKGLFLDDLALALGLPQGGHVPGDDHRADHGTMGVPERGDRVGPDGIGHPRARVLEGTRLPAEGGPQVPSR
jgi:hypothetical protein